MYSMYSRILKLPLAFDQSIFLFGPRGTGKTSWIKQNLPNSLYIDLLDFSFYKSLSSQPNRLEKLIPKNYHDWVIIDEVQRSPLLLNEVHRLIEHKKFKFLLTGSSARSLHRKGVNLLAGRALRYNLYPLTIQELKDDFDLAQTLNYGLLPSIYTSENPQKYLETYVQTYLREEVLQEGIIRNIQAFINFLETASFSQGSILNYSEIARETGNNRQTVMNYFSILDDLLLTTHLLPFTKHAKRRMISHPKFYYFDCGIYRILRPKGILDKPEEIEGAALETIFLHSLRAINDYYELGYNIYYWRTADGTEVDFVLYGEKGFHAFEIKRTNTITPKILRGLKSFKKDYPQATLHLVFGGDHQEFHDEITVWPFIDALKKLPEILANKSPI
jgi:uncharacterized protein